MNANPMVLAITFACFIPVFCWYRLLFETIQNFKDQKMVLVFGIGIEPYISSVFILFLPSPHDQGISSSHHSLASILAMY